MQVTLHSMLAAFAFVIFKKERKLIQIKERTLRILLRSNH